MKYTILVLSLLLQSCDYQPVRDSSGRAIANEMIEIYLKGHSYIRFTDPNVGYSFVHDPDCECRKNTKIEGF